MKLNHYLIRARYLNKKGVIVLNATGETLTERLSELGRSYKISSVKKIKGVVK